MATITNTKLSQGQIKGTGKDHLGAELSAVESAIAGALGKAGYEGGADISLKDLGEMVDGDAAGMTLKVDVAAAGFDITGAGEMAAGVGTFSNTSAGILTATSAAVAGVATVGGSLDVDGAATLASVTVEGTSALVGNVNASGNVTIAGDLFVNGTQTVMNTAQVEIEDDHLVIAKGKPSLVGGEGFALVSDAGTHFMHWDASNRWNISDGVMTPHAKFGNVTVNSTGMGSAAGSDLKVMSSDQLIFRDGFMSADLDFSKSGEYAAIFGASGWASGSEGLLGLFTKVKSDASAALLAASGSLASMIVAEKDRALAAESDLQADIDAEAATRAAADVAHDAAIAAEIVRATAAEAALQADIDAEEAARIAAVSAEESARIAADNALTSALNAEIARATAAEGVLTVNLAAEVTRAQGVEAGLQAEIDALEVTELAHYNELDAAITAEETRALAAEAALQAEIDAEELARAAAVSAEAAARIAADNALTASLNAEISRALAAEAVLAADLATETARALAAETVLAGEIDALEALVAAQAFKVWSAVVPAGGVLANAAMAGWATAFDGVKSDSAYDVFVNGQLQALSSDFNIVGGAIKFAFAMSEGDVVFVREN